MVELSPGDFLYQSDQELFLVVIEERDDSYLFAAHGWREIDEGRVDQYIDDSKSKIHRQEEVEELIDEKADGDTQERFEQLKDLFAQYEEIEFEEDGPQSDFKLDDQ